MSHMKNLDLFALKNKKKKYQNFVCYKFCLAQGLKVSYL